MKKTLATFLLGLFLTAQLTHAVPTVIQPAGHWNPSTIPDWQNAFFAVNVSGSTEQTFYGYAHLGCCTGPYIYLWSSMQARDALDTSASTVVAGVRNFFDGTGGQDSTLILTQRHSSGISVAMQYKKSGVLSNGSDNFDIKLMNSNAADIDSAIAHALVGIGDSAHFDSVFTQSLNIMGGSPIPGRIFLSSTSTDAILAWSDEDSHTFTITQEHTDAGVLKFNSTSGSDLFEFEIASQFDGNVVFGAFPSFAVLGTDAGGNLFSQSITGTLGNVVLSGSPSITSPTLFTSLNLNYASASRFLYSDGSKNVVSLASTGALSVLRYNSANNNVEAAVPTGTGAPVNATSAALATPTITSGTFATAATYSYATANRPAWFNGSSGLRSTSVSGTLDTLVTNKGPVFWGAFVHGRLDVDSLFATHLFTTDTTSYKPFLRADTLAVTYQLRCNYCTASRPWYIDASGNAVTGTFTGSGTTFMLSASPTTTGTLTAAALTASGTVTFSGMTGTGTRLVTATSSGVLGNATSIAGSYVWGGGADWNGMGGFNAGLSSTDVYLNCASSAGPNVSDASISCVDGVALYIEGAGVAGMVIAADKNRNTNIVLDKRFNGISFSGEISGAPFKAFNISGNGDTAFVPFVSTNTAIGGKFLGPLTARSLKADTLYFGVAGSPAGYFYTTLSPNTIHSNGPFYADGDLTADGNLDIGGIIRIGGNDALSSDAGNLTIGLGDGKTISLGQGGAGLISALGPFNAPTVTVSGLIGGSVDVGVCADHTTGTLYAGTLSLGALICAGI